MSRARVIKNEWTKSGIDEMLDKYIPVTVPVSIKISGKQKVLGFAEVKKILKDSKLVSLENCSCRADRKNCDAPLDVCVCLDEEAEEAIRDRGAWRTTHEKAMEALRLAHNAGLVHLAYKAKGKNRIKIICSCCACCCHTLAAITRFGYHCDIVECADVIATRDESSCTNCGVCIERCHFDAWGLVGDEVHHYPLRCAGCGVCASFCPSGAIKMVKRRRNGGGREKHKRKRG